MRCIQLQTGILVLAGAIEKVGVELQDQLLCDISSKVLLLDFSRHTQGYADSTISLMAAITKTLRLLLGGKPLQQSSTGTYLALVVFHGPEAARAVKAALVGAFAAQAHH